MENKKEYTSAPLPFMGQKRNFLKDFKIALKQYPENAVYVDLFGGSGILAHTIKSIYPKSTVIYNDFDDYRKRLESIPKTNLILKEIREIVKDYPKDKKIAEHLKQQILKIVKKYHEKGYIDFITISSSLRFGMNYDTSMEELQKGTYYNCVRKNSYNVPEGYLKGLEVVKMDYRQLFDIYKENHNVVFIVDPPYLQTVSFTYKNYWNLTDYLDVLDVIKSNRYFFFTSNKSSLLELFQWFEDRTNHENPFNGATQVLQNKTINYQSTYTDIMLFK